MQHDSSHTDEELLQLLYHGDEKAFHEIYQRYWKRMFAMAMLRLQRREIAEDIVQDVFSALWKRREVANIIILENWLATAVKYKVLTELHRSLRKEIFPDNLPETALADNAIDFHFLEQQVAEEVNRLPEKCKIVFKYSREMGLSNKEIARQLSISEKAVEKHITRARRQLGISLRNFFHSFFSLI